LIWDWTNEDATFVVLYGFLALGIWVQFFAFLRVMLTSRRDDWQRAEMEREHAA
jgi:hypothetical protein